MPKEKSRKNGKSKEKESGAHPEENGSGLRRTLVVDIGGSGIKATVLNDLAKPVTERLRRESPASGMPGAVMDIIVALANELGDYERVAVGFPGVVINGVAMDAPNLAKEWQGFNIAESLQGRLKKPVRVANDADVQGFGAIAGSGVELVVTLGTGVGTSLFVDGRLAPNLEIGNDKLRNSALQKVGKRRWNKRLIKFIKRLDETFHFKKLYIGGGNSREVDVSLLPPNVTIVSNLNGLVGGLALWRDEAPSSAAPAEKAEETGRPLAA
jgi:polyphosphate glucokinase